jgi:F-type H+-transporting ATPase subunit b
VELDWTSFTLEIINFLILIWILKKLLISPLRRVMSERRSIMENEAQKIRKMKAEAEIMRMDLEKRLQQWNQEKQQLHEKFRQELEAEKAGKLREYENYLANEKLRQELEAKHLAERIYPDLEKQAVQRGLQFLSKLLTQLASPELEGSIIRLILEDLRSHPPAEIETIKLSDIDRIQVRSAFQLTESQQQELAEGLAQILGGRTPMDYQVHKELIAGLELVMDSMSIKGNLRDELVLFAEV